MFKAIYKVRKLPNKPLEFLIEWVGFLAEDAFTWEPVKNLPNNVATLHEFKEKNISEDKRGDQHGSSQNSTSK